MNKKIYFLLFHLFLVQFIFAQDLFVKQTTNIPPFSINNPQIVGLSDGRSVTVASTENDLNVKGLIVVQYDPCGEIIWSKNIEHQIDIKLVDVVKDLNNNILITGYLDDPNIRIPYLISLHQNGTINFFKKFTNSSNYGCLTYSIDVSPTNDYYMYINYNTSTAGPAARPSVLKLNPNGSMVWFKTYDIFSWHYGFMLATSDGGTLFSMNRTFIKTDSSGNIQWMNSYNGNIDPHKGIETNMGYIFSSIDNSAAIPINFLMLNKDGSVRWTIENLNTYITTSGLKRKNGNFLFIGRGSILTNNALLELDPNNGLLISYKELKSIQNFSGIYINDFYEDKDENIVASGINPQLFVPELNILKINDTLSLVNCPDTTFTPTYTLDTISKNIESPIAVSFNNSLIINKEQYTINQLAISNSTLCSFYKNKTAPNLGKDTIICEQSTLTLQDTNSVFDNYLWSTGEKTATITINKSGWYWLATISACDTLKDSILVQFFNKNLLNLGADTSLCEGDSITLRNTTPLSNYLWSNSDTTAQISVKDTGWYWLEYSSKCGLIRDSIHLNFKSQLEPFSIGNDTTICPNDSLVLRPNKTQINYLWSNGMITSNITVKDSGSYWLEVKGECNTLRDSINIRHFPELLFNYSISKDTAFTQENIYFQNYNSTTHSITWELGNGHIFTTDSFEYSFKMPGLYPIIISMVSADGCEFKDTVKLTILASPIIIPNVFSPNNDGINDIFFPFGKDIEHYQMTIFNRWGQIVYEGENTPWDGQFKNGKMGSDGTYYYIINIVLFNKSSLIYRGQLQKIN